MARSRRRDDDDDDLPRKKRKHYHDDDDDDDEDDDRPVLKKRKKVGRKSAGGAGLLIGLGVGAVVLLGGVAALVWALGGGVGGMVESPQKGFQEFQGAATGKNYGVFYDRMDTDTQAMTDSLMQWQAQMVVAFVPNSPLAGKKGRELFVAWCREADKSPGQHDNTVDQWARRRATVQGVRTTSETTADVTVKNADGSTEVVPMVKQNGTWRVQLLGGSFGGGNNNPFGGNNNNPFGNNPFGNKPFGR